MNILNTQEHVSWDCAFHIVIVPKYRKKLLYLHARKEIGAIIRALAKQKGIEILEGNAQPDHIHMLVSIPPKYSVANTVGFIKGKSAILLHNRFGNRNRNIMQKHFWSRGYFVRTVGVDQETIRNYVRNQWKKDQTVDGNQLDFRWN